MNIFKFVAKFHHNAAWKILYENVCFLIASKTNIESVLAQDKISVVDRTNVRVSKDLPPPWSFMEDTGKRKEDFYERGTAKKGNDVTAAVLHELCKKSDKYLLHQLLSCIYIFKNVFHFS